MIFGTATGNDTGMGTDRKGYYLIIINSSLVYDLNLVLCLCGSLVMITNLLTHFIGMAMM